MTEQFRKRLLPGSGETDCTAIGFAIIMIINFGEGLQSLTDSLSSLDNRSALQNQVGITAHY